MFLLESCIIRLFNSLKMHNNDHHKIMNGSVNMKGRLHKYITQHREYRFSWWEITITAGRKCKDRLWTGKCNNQNNGNELMCLINAKWSGARSKYVTAVWWKSAWCSWPFVKHNILEHILIFFCLHLTWTELGLSTWFAAWLNYKCTSNPIKLLSGHKILNMDTEGRGVCVSRLDVCVVNRVSFSFYTEGWN